MEINLGAETETKIETNTEMEMDMNMNTYTKTETWRRTIRCRMGSVRVQNGRTPPPWNNTKIIVCHSCGWKEFWYFYWGYVRDRR